MRVVMFVHSLLSDWNHGNAHFLRGIVTELLHRGHDVRVYEPADGWSLENLRSEHGPLPIVQFQRAFPHLCSTSYSLPTLDLNGVLDEADLVIVHEWNDYELVRRVGQHRAARGTYKLLFHDTHHRALTRPQEMSRYDLRDYDGVLAFGRVLRDLYLKKRWSTRAWTWHEAADTTLFRPIADASREGDLVWIGNWGDDERTAELTEFLIAPVKSLGLSARVHGVRYPGEARDALAGAGIGYAGWLPNVRVPAVFAAFKVTVHVPRRPYVQALPGIPTIRVFEALACGIPLVCSPWDDIEELFTPGSDYLVARNGAEMRRHLRGMLEDPALARDLALNGHRTILSRHTCAHRVDELMAICAELDDDRRTRRPRARKRPARSRQRSPAAASSGHQRSSK
jgi:spore maturation protein CgeB